VKNNGVVGHYAQKRPALLLLVEHCIREIDVLQLKRNIVGQTRAMRTRVGE
jgi:hypothetical protein